MEFAERKGWGQTAVNLQVERLPWLVLCSLRSFRQERGFLVQGFVVTCLSKMGKPGSRVPSVPVRERGHSSHVCALRPTVSDP